MKTKMIYLNNGLNAKKLYSAHNLFKKKTPKYV